MLHHPQFKAHFQFTGNTRWVLYLPFISLAAVFTEMTYKIVTGANPFSYLDMGVNQLIINILLLNSLHLIFPFMILLLLPHGREFIRAKSVLWSRNWITGLSVVFIISILFLVSLQSVKSLNFLSPIKPWLASAMVWVWYLVPTFHGMRQSAGVSQLLVAPSQRDDEKFLRAKHRERKLLRFYYTGVIFTFVSQKWWAASFPEMVWIMTSISMILAIAIIFNARQTAATGFKDKFIFSFRFLLWPLQPYSQIVLWSVVFNHGIEYIALLQHILKSSKEQTSGRRMFVATTVLGMALISIYNIFEYFYQVYPSWVVESWTLSFILAFYPFLTLLHYAIDGVAYRMSDPDVQKTIGRFFATPTNNEST